MTPLQGLGLLLGLKLAKDVIAPRDRQVLRGGMSVRHREVATIEERVAAMNEMAEAGRDDPVIRRFTVQAVSARCGRSWCVPEGDERAEVEAVFAALRERYRYVSDTFGKDLFQHPARTLEFGGGDCDCATTLVAACLGSIGYQTGARVVQTRGHDWWNHVYAIVALPKRRPTELVPLDLSVPEATPGWEVPRRHVVRKADFLFG